MEIQNMKNKNYKLIDIFSGIGCASLGFRKAGFDLAGALEINPLRCKLYQENLGLKPIQNDVMKISGINLLSNAKVRKGGKFCVVGCPPCQSFSHLSDTSGIDTLNDPRSKYVEKFAKLVVEMKPSAVVFENVQGMISGPGKKFFDKYLKTLRKNDYETCYKIINAADFGVPQNRKRIIAISIRKKFLKKNTMDEIEEFLQYKIKKRKTVRHAIKGLKPLRPGQKSSTDLHHSARSHSQQVYNILKHVPKNGGGRKDMPKRYWLNCHKKLKKGAETVYGRMRWNEPSPTMTCRCCTPSCGRFIHPSQSRGISVREAARLQTIPDNFKLSPFSNRNEEAIGDAVPVLLARKIAEKLLEVMQ